MPFTENAQLEEGGNDTTHLTLKGNKIFHISGRLNAYKFFDKDTNMFVCFIPSFSISGYGDTIQEAQSMMHFSVEDFFQYLCDIPLKKARIEIKSFGWEQNKIRTKDYSKSYVDINGQLKNFNIDLGSIERTTLVTA